MSDTAARLATKVEQKLSSARQIARTTLGVIPGGLPADVVNQLFTTAVGDLKLRRKPMYWSNYPRDIPFLHQLLIGPPAIIDLLPVSEDEFQRRFSLTGKEMLSLVGEGLVVPNVYTRSPEAWSRARCDLSYLEGLIDHSVACGELTDEYLSHRQPNYDRVVEEGREHLEATLRAISTAELGEVVRRNRFRLASPNDDSRAVAAEVARIVGKNWGYINVLASDPEKIDICELLPKPTLDLADRAVQRIRFEKHRLASPLTAALGGYFFWPGEGFDPPSSSAKGTGPIWIDQYEDLKEKRELLTHVAQRIYDTQRQNPYTVDRDGLLSFLRTTDFRERSEAIWTIQETIGPMVASGQLRDQSFQELERHHLELREQVARDARTLADTGFALRAGGIVVGAIAALPFGFWPLVGAGAGSALAGLYLGHSNNAAEIAKSFCGGLASDRSRYLKSVDALTSVRPSKSVE
jgi:hypothetical protein